MPVGSLGRPAAGVDVAVVDPETGRVLRRPVSTSTGACSTPARRPARSSTASGPGRFEGYYGVAGCRGRADPERLVLDRRPRLPRRRRLLLLRRSRGDWLRVDSENFAAGPVEAVLSRHPDVTVAAVYPVPDTTAGAGDQVMAAVELRPGTAFDADGFAALAGRPTRPRDQVGAPLRPPQPVAAPDRQRQGHQGLPARRRLARSRPHLVAPGRRRRPLPTADPGRPGRARRRAGCATPRLGGAPAKPRPGQPRPD